MTPRHEAAWFALALEKPASERAAWLGREGGDDQALRSRLEALLAAHEAPAGGLADEPVQEVLAPHLTCPSPPRPKRWA